MNDSEKFRPVFVPPNDQGREGPEKIEQQENDKRADFSLDGVKNWEEKDGKIYLKKIEAISTPLWHTGWYRNPSSGRSNNCGVNTEKPQEHFTVVVKGGCFYVDEKCKEFFERNSLSLDELYGGISFDAARKEYDIAGLIQESFRSLLHKKANCPEPIDVQAVTDILNERNEVVDLGDFFVSELRKESGETKFTMNNFAKVAAKLGIDMFYPMGEEADENIRKNPFRWLFGECLEKNKQGVYRYKIDGPNTRLLDLMTLGLADRQKYFIEANNATVIRDAVERFSSKLGEFYGVLHKSNISYHSGSSEHCTLVDITISGVIMDIGGLSQDNSLGGQSESYLAQIFKTTNLIAYLCTNIFKVDRTILQSALNIFWDKYKSLYADENIEYFSRPENIPDEPDKIRTQYFNALAGNWTTLAPDLKDLSWDR